MLLDKNVYLKQDINGKLKRQRLHQWNSKLKQKNNPANKTTKVHSFNFF